MIEEVIENMTAKQSKVMGYTLNKSFKSGVKEGDKIIRKMRITASAATVGFDMSKVADTHLRNITKSNIGHLGKYNDQLSKSLSLEFKTLLADNKLVNTLNEGGWSPNIEKALIKRGTSAEVIALAKGQSTMNKVINTLEHNGIRGGMNPREVSRLLQPAVGNYFGPKGVLIDNVGKFKKVLKVDADGNYKYVKQAITRPYRATPKSYSNLLARSSMINAHHEGRYQSLQKTGLVDHYISESLLDANTCNLCATMHGQRVSHSEGPLYHPSGACKLKPIWKKDSGIPNKDPSFYDKQRDQHFWKQHQLAEYNKGMPKGAKLKFHSMLPKDAISAMPNKAAMRTIRYNALGKPGAIKPTIIKPKVAKIKPPSVKPKVTKVKPKVVEKITKPVEKKVVKEKIVKPKATKKAQIEKIKKEEREKADELWKKTAKDGNEHAKITNSKTIYMDGDKKGVKMPRLETLHQQQHTHPNWDAPLSGGDLSVFLKNPSTTQLSASSPKNIYVVKRRIDTIIPKESGIVLRTKHDDLYKKMAKEMVGDFKKKTGRLPTPKQAQKISRDALINANKAVAKEYNVDYMVFTRT